MNVCMSSCKAEADPLPGLESATMMQYHADCTEQFQCILSQSQHIQASLSSSQSPQHSLHGQRSITLVFMQLMPTGAVFSFLFLHVYAPKDSYHLLLSLQKSLGVLLLVVPDVDVPDTPRAIFGGCHHLCGVRCKSQAQYLTLVTLWQSIDPGSTCSLWHGWLYASVPRAIILCDGMHAWWVCFSRAGG